MLQELEAEWVKTSRNLTMNAGDASVSKQLQSVEDRISVVKRSLYKLDSTTYASYADEGYSATKVGFY